MSSAGRPRRDRAGGQAGGQRARGSMQAERGNIQSSNVGGLLYCCRTHEKQMGLVLVPAELRVSCEVEVRAAGDGLYLYLKLKVHAGAWRLSSGNYTASPYLRTHAGDAAGDGADEAAASIHSMLRRERGPGVAVLLGWTRVLLV